MDRTKKTLIVLGISIVVFLGLVLPLDEWIVLAYQWSLDNPALSRLAFVGVFILWVVVALPGSILVTLAGFLYGLPGGMVLVLCGSMVGSTLAFLIGHHLARQAIEKRIGDSPKLRAIDHAINESGLSIVILTRLSMVLPYSLLNYAFGLTSVNLRDYFIGTTAGMVLPQLLFVFVGTTAKDITAVVRGDLQLENQAWLIAGFGLIAISVTVFLITRKAKLALERAIHHTAS